MLLTSVQIRRFWSRVDKKGPDECWLWTAGRFNHGYGRFFVWPKERTAHWVSYVLAYGELPHGTETCHKCDVKLCVNPNHLFAATHQENVQDSTRKGRRARLKGMTNKNAKLTDAHVLEMRRIYELGEASTPMLGRMFDVSQATAFNIVARKTWTHI